MKRQTLCLCMIVKNEAHIILETLNSIKHHLDYWVICDTGSTDSTVALIQDFFKTENIPGEIHIEPWVDFGYNRSRAFALAMHKADYVLVIDADDVLVGDLKLNTLEADSYSLRYGTDFTYWRSQIFKASETWIYKGVLHEYADCLSQATPSSGYLQGDYHILSRRMGARSLIDPAAKYANDARVMEQALEHEADPGLATRYLFYIAQSHRDCGNSELAIAWYQKRIDAGGWEEEVWSAKYETGLLHEKSGHFGSAKQSYLDAFEHRPTRAESLYSLGKMCNVRSEFFQAYLFLESALEIPFTADVLFVMKDAYDYQIAFELSISAYWVGNYPLCIKLCERLIAMRDRLPEDVYRQTLKNMAFGVEKLLAAV